MPSKVPEIVMDKYNPVQEFYMIEKLNQFYSLWKNKDFKKSDEIRDFILSHGIKITYYDDYIFYVGLVLNGEGYRTITGIIS